MVIWSGTLKTGCLWARRPHKTFEEHKTSFRILCCEILGGFGMFWWHLGRKMCNSHTLVSFQVIKVMAKEYKRAASPLYLSLYMFQKLWLEHGCCDRLR